MASRKLTTKARRKEILKEMGYTETDMNKFWEQCKEVSLKVRVMSENGMDWTDLPESEIRKLPTLEDEILKLRRQEEEKKEAELKAKKEKEEQEKYYYEHFDEIMLNKIDNGEPLTEDELRSLVFDWGEVERINGENRRWSRTVKSIIDIRGRKFAIEWEEGLTEHQEDCFYEQPYEVELHQEEKVIVVNTWKRKGK